MNRPDPDAPIVPIDPADDARRRAGARSATRRSGLAAVVALIQPLAALAGGGLLGAALHGAPMTGALGLLCGWLFARAVLLAFGLPAAVAALPALARRADRPLRVGRIARGLGLLAILMHGLAFTAAGIVTALACAWAGAPGALLVSMASFGAAGALLAGLTLLAGAEGA